MQQVIVCVHEDHDTSVVVGPFRSEDKVWAADQKLQDKGWITEIVECVAVGDVPNMNEGR